MNSYAGKFGEVLRGDSADGEVGALVPGEVFLEVGRAGEEGFVCGGGGELGNARASGRKQAACWAVVG